MQHFESQLRSAIEKQNHKLSEFTQRMRKFELEQGHMVRTHEFLEKQLKLQHEQNEGQHKQIAKALEEVREEIQ